MYIIGKILPDLSYKGILDFLFNLALIIIYPLYLDSGGNRRGQIHGCQWPARVLSRSCSMYCAAGVGYDGAEQGSHC